MPSTRRLASLSALVLVAAACAKKDAATTDTAAMSAPADSTAMAPAPAAPAAPNDAQIAHIAVTANAIDSTAGELAKGKASGKDVKAFAADMVRDHGAVNQQAVALVTKLKVTPEDNDVSRGLKAGADSSNTNLQGLTGAAFDKAYIDHEVAYHQAVLDALDKTLVPDAQNAELKALLEKVRPAVAEHLEHAKKLQTSLNK